MNYSEQESKGRVVIERALLISPTSHVSEIPPDQASQGITIEALRALAEHNLKQRLQNALGYQGVKWR